jgi:hypothetical protein
VITSCCCAVSTRAEPCCAAFVPPTVPPIPGVAHSMISSLSCAGCFGGIGSGRVDFRKGPLPAKTQWHAHAWPFVRVPGLARRGSGAGGPGLRGGESCGDLRPGRGSARAGYAFVAIVGSMRGQLHRSCRNGPCPTSMPCGGRLAAPVPAAITQNIAILLRLGDSRESLSLGWPIKSHRVQCHVHRDRVAVDPPFAGIGSRKCAPALNRSASEGQARASSCAKAAYGRSQNEGGSGSPAGTGCLRDVGREGAAPPVHPACRVNHRCMKWAAGTRASQTP